MRPETNPRMSPDQNLGRNPGRKPNPCAAPRPARRLGRRLGRWPWAALLPIALALASGCVTLGQGGATFALHDLGPVLTQASQAAEEAGFVLVGVDAPGWLQDDRIRYRLLYDDPTKIRYYSQDRWVAAPPQLLTQRLAEAGAEGVRVRLTLLAFEQIFSRPGVAEVVLDLRVTALSEDLVPVREHLLRLRQPTSPNAAGVIDAFPHLVDRAIAEIQAWLASPGSPSTPAAKRGLVKDTKAGKGGKAKAGKTKASAPAPGAREIGAPGRSPARGSAPPSTDPPN